MQKEIEVYALQQELLRPKAPKDPILSCLKLLARFKRKDSKMLI